MRSMCGAAQNPTSQVYKACKRIKTDRRVALTGYPLQNNLKEYYHMVHWVQSKCGLGTEAEFALNYSNVITRGGSP